MKSIQQLHQNLSSFLFCSFPFRDFGLGSGLYQTSFEADNVRYLSKINGSGEVEVGRVKDGKGKCKYDSEILQV